MFEGLVKQLLVGYLGRYVKDIHQDQLKITLWHEEVLLENVELILEAFDYLQLPFALKQGCIGKLSIKIPWKKLGWDPIIIVLENVFVCASCRDDHEWSSDTVTRREIAAKKAKLAAAELAKFSKRVCDNQVGQSFISYITAKILDSIQVSIRNVHLAYHDKLEKEQVVFGLRFSSLIITKQNPDRSFSGKLRGAQGNKDVEISDIELLCRTMSGADNLTSIDDFRDPKFYTNAGVKGNKFGCVLASFDLSLSLSVDREKLDNKVAPPYSVNAELAGLAIALDEVQLLQILVLFDNLRASHLREKYWCYRPWSTISRKDKGWQVAWWHYAQESVLSDVRKKMKRTSWKYFGQRLSYRRRYVNLYKTKLRLIRQEQPINESVLCEMEQLERESDIDDILSYRSIAESELQEFLLNPPNLNRELNEANIIVDKFQTDESFSGRSRGWLNWLSLGMLGAGGTDDLVQFSGVVSDDIVKDIYKATKFNPVNLPDGAAASQTVYLSAVKITIPQLTANFRCMKLNQGIAALVLDGGVIECKYWAKSAAIVATVKYLKMVNPYKRNGILSIQKSMIEDTNLGNEQASLSVQIDISPEIQEGEISVKVMLEPVELTYDSEFVKNTIEFYNMLNSYKSQSARVLASLNGIKDVKARLISKAECILSNSRKVVWDAIFTNVKINIPYGSVSSDRCTLVVMLGSLLLTSKRALGSLPPLIEDHSSILNDILNSIFANNFPHGFRLEDLYNFIEIQLNDCEVKIVQPYASETVSIIEKFYAPIVLASCIIPDEAMLKQFEVHMILPSLRAHFSSFIYGSVLELMSQIDDMHSKFEHLARDPESRVHRSNCASNVSQNFMRMVGSACFLIHLDYDGQDSSIIAVTLQEVDIQYTHKEFDRCIVCIKALKAITYSTTDQRNNQILCLIGNLCPTSPAHQHGMPVGHENPCDTCFSGKTSTDISILLHYDAFNSMDVIHHHCTLWLNDIDVHCYPHIFKLIFGFYDRLCARGTSDLDLDSSSHVASAESPKPSMFFPFREFGFSNYSKTQPSEYLGISLDHFPFVTIQNSGFLGNLESSLVYSINEWKENLKLVDRKITLPKLPEEMGPEIFYVETLKSTSLKDLPPFPENSCNNSIFLANLNANELRVHFHDSSCIIGTTALTMCRSLLSVHSGSIDLLCSIEGLTLSSSWCPSVLLWGPHLPYLSSILNIRMKNAIDRSLSCQTELYFGIQNVCCILPPEYLTIVVGYFSLPEWSSNANKQTDGHTGSEHASCILYKFEILDSTLIVPVERSNNYYLKLKLPQLYCSFIPGSGSVSNNASDCVPSCFSGPDHKIAELNHALNFFGRDLSLFYLFPKDGKNGILMLDHHNRHTLFTLMLPLNADIWIEIPSNNDCSSASSQAARPTCIRLRLYNSQFFIRDDHVLDGYRALIDIINQFSLVGEESKFFKHDIPQFLQLKKSKKEHSNVILASSAVTLTELKCEVNSLSVKLCCSREDFDSLEPVATVDLQFECSASLRNEVPVSLGLYVSSIVLFANSTVLAQCISPCPTSSVIQIKLPMLDLVKNEISIYFPSFDIWLHLFEWNEIIELFKSYSRQLTEPSVTHVPVKQDAVFLTGKLKNVFLACHIPLWVSEEAFSEFEFPDIQEQNKPGHVSSNNIKGKAHRFVTVSLHGGASEISLQDREIKFQCTLGKISTAIDTCEGTSGWPFLQIHQINVVAEIFTNHTKLMKLPYVKAEVRFDRFEVWFSHHVLYFWHKIHFNIPEAGPSKFVLGGLDLGIEWRKASLLLIDGRWSCSAPFLEILLRNFILHSSITDINMEGFATSDLEVNYNNIQKVLWEPFVEPWKFQLKVTRIHGTSALLTSSTRTDIHLDSIMQLNLNITEPVIECFIRASEMLKDACGLMGPNDMFAHQKFLNHQITYDVCAGRYAPYIVQNLTSLPLVFHVSKGKIDFSGVGAPSLKDGKSLQPNSSVPVYISETLEEQLIDYGPSRSSDKLNEKQSSSVVHHFITIQFDGTPSPSAPISMDLVGRTCFEVDFSYIPNKVEDESSRKIEENGRRYPCSGCIVPVVIEVSVQRYSRLIQLYSAVILSNGTSTPLELRFDIPFGLSPKILGPVYPDADFPVPLHLSEAGRLSWRPVGNSYLWSETRSLLDILSREKRTGFVRPFVCYPRNPSSDPFRCCISVQDSSFLSSDRINKGPFCHIKDTEKSVAHDNPSSSNLDTSNKRSIHQINLMTPLVVKNYLPVRLSLTIESGGLIRTALLSEVETPFFHIDSSHDLNLVFDMHGYKPSRLNFQRTETFSTIAKFSGTKFSQSETLSFDPNSCSSPVYATVEKLMDASSGARELCVFVPLLLYNCTGFHLIISDSTDEDRGNFCIIPSCYDSIEEEPLSCEKDGLLLFSSHEDLCAAPQHINSHDSSLNGNHIVSTRKIKNKQSRRLQSHKGSNIVDDGCSKVKACLYCPMPNMIASESLVRVRKCLPEWVPNNVSTTSWSSPFSIVTPNGSTTVLVPDRSINAASIISVTSSAVGGSLAGRTRAVTFQPRYVISNACSKDLCYKQKATDVFFNLGVGQHTHLSWEDTTSELLVSIRFNEPGWQWSGSFSPDHLGDTQVKMRNYMSGALEMIRVEVQNGDVSGRDEKIIGNLHGNSGTNLILLSDDDTGFMPYRIDNFSKETLRVFQQKCVSFETTVHPYTSCPYAWDEPCAPHRLTIEVPGERTLGLYALDDVKNHVPVCLPSTVEKPERKLLVSVHAERARKVLSVMDATYHVLKDVKDPSASRVKENRKNDCKQETVVSYKERLSINIPYIGISLIDSLRQELLFVCAKNTMLDLFQSLDQQKLFFKIESLQVDNQLQNTRYPVILSFDHDCSRHSLASQTGTKGNGTNIAIQVASDSSCEPAFSIAAAKWRSNDPSLVSFEYIKIRVADFLLELEQEVILNVLEFSRSILLTLQGRILPYGDSKLHTAGVETRFFSPGVSFSTENRKSSSPLPSFIPIGAPWQQIHHRRQKKFYIELIDLASVKLTFSFSSTPWMLRNGILTSGESLIHRGLMALADIEGAQIHLKQLIIEHHMASWESIQEILVRHYTRQLLHETYKVFGSAGVIGNPMGFARTMGLGIKDFLSAPAKSVLQSPAGLITGVAQGTTSLLSNTVYAVSDAATQISRAAHKGIVAFTFDDLSTIEMEKQKRGLSSQSKGVINEFLEGLTGVLQLPIKGAEKHGLPGVLSGIALGVTGLVARPTASILEVTGKTAQSIRNRTKFHQMRSHRFRVRLPRALRVDLPLRPYSWEEAVGASVLATDERLKDEELVMCKALKQGGKFVILTGRLLLTVSCSGFAKLGTPEFEGVPADPEWVTEAEIGLESVIHADSEEAAVHIVGSSLEMFGRQFHYQQRRGKPGNNSPLSQTDLEFPSKEEAEEFLRVLVFAVERGKERGWGSGQILHQSNLK